MRVRSPWLWVGWLLVMAVLAGGSFALFESMALSDPDGLTLSQFVVSVGHAWPPIVPLFWGAFGLLVGILISHFYWVWVPKQRRATCGQCGKMILLGEPK